MARRVVAHNVFFPASKCSMLTQVQSAASMPIPTSGGSNQYAFGRRVVMEEDGYLVGYGIEFDSLITGSGATWNVNAGFFNCNNDTHRSPADLLGACEGIMQATSAEMSGWSSKHIQDVYFQRATWLRKGTPLWFGGKQEISGTVSAGAVVGYLLHDPRAALNGNASYRGAIRTSSTVAYSNGTLAGFWAGLGAFPTGITGVNSTSSSSDNIAVMNVHLIVNLTRG